MAITFANKPDSPLLEVQATGKLSHADYEQFAPVFERFLARHGKARILFEMVDFHGWEIAALWDDIRFDLKHFTHIDRLAMVGDRKWEKGMSAVCHLFTSATIRFFDTSDASTARAWLEEP